jgi:hypothetical protein
VFVCVCVRACVRAPELVRLPERVTHTLVRLGSSADGLLYDCGVDIELGRAPRASGRSLPQRSPPVRRSAAAARQLRRRVCRGSESARCRRRECMSARALRSAAAAAAARVRMHIRRGLRLRVVSMIRAPHSDHE